MTPERLGLLWGVTVFAGATAQALAWLTGLPGVVLLLSAGLVIGRSGFGLVEPLDLGAGLGTVVGLLVSLVLFDGGINLRLPGDATKQAVLRIVLVRLVLGLAAGLLAAHWLAGLNWSLAAVFSAIVLATGPTVVTPLVRQIRLAPPLGEVLEGEGLILEPIGAVLALLLLELALGDLHGWRELALGLLQRLGGGVAIGALCGWLLAEALCRIPAQPAGALRLQLTLGTLFLMFSGCELLLPESGLPAAVAAGVVVGRRPDTDAAELDELIRQLAQLAITMLFPLLAADVSWAELSPLGWGGVACVLSLMLLVRPVAIGLATWGLAFSLPQRALMSWLAPRGIVTAAVASLFAIRLEQAGVVGAGRLQGLVFLTILLTVGLQGLSAGPLARWLGLSEAAGDAGAVVAASVQQQPGGQ
ncbi:MULTISPECIES: cation:proton antiporter [unclassified Cyanobium]|uniref:cation:proton antiporter domain-containing protein n=1 Tax=unclassified Cyanobium TaxID=2627006 RepID=UPI0020CF1C7A|nr:MULTISPECIES: cation:proton antiporter [unclassified Cyanobium]MCP9777817.1 cation:proton antiporter [Cyanobium sp. Tous-M-B4]MCP9875279.1 cation:proton antiporter [Cyanobium sp. A2C-AMD]